MPNERGFISSVYTQRERACNYDQINLADNKKTDAFSCQKPATDFETLDNTLFDNSISLFAKNKFFLQLKLMVISV